MVRALGVALMPWKTVIENVSMGPKFRGVSKKEREEKAKYFINLVGLSGFENSFPYQLSGGMKQRVGIARAYCSDPDVLLMDEPFGALDTQTRYMMEEEILRIWEKAKRTVVFVTNNIKLRYYLEDEVIRIWRELKRTVIFVTHNIEEAVYLAERILILTPKPAIYSS